MRFPQGSKNKEPVRVLCPFCLNMVVVNQVEKDLPWHSKMTVDVCSICRQKHPPGFKIYNPEDVVILSGIGFEGHGKTVYMASLFHVLRRVLPACWESYFIDIMDHESLKEVKHRINELAEEGKVPDTTPATFPRPTVTVQKRTYVRGQLVGEIGTLFYDTGGESFRSPGLLQENAGYLVRARTAVFIVGLPELLGSRYPGDMLNDLLQVYRNGMRGLGADLSLQQLIIVYTKADAVLDRLPAWIRDYLETGHDAYPRPQDLSNYYQGMTCASKLLQEYTGQLRGAKGFGNMAKQFESVRFCAVSALGFAPVGNRLFAPISPRRVLDPFLWAMLTPGTQKQRKRKRGLFGLW